MSWPRQVIIGVIAVILTIDFLIVVFQLLMGSLWYIGMGVRVTNTLIDRIPLYASLFALALVIIAAFTAWEYFKSD